MVSPQGESAVELNNFRAEWPGIVGDSEPTEVEDTKNSEAVSLLKDNDSGHLQKERHSSSEWKKRVAAVLAFTLLLCLFFALVFVLLQSYDQKPPEADVPSVPPPFVYSSCKGSGNATTNTSIYSLTLEEKISQMIVTDANDILNENLLPSFSIGGAIFNNLDSNVTTRSPSQWLRTTQDLQEKALRTRSKIPLLIGATSMGGHVGVHGSTLFPHQIGIGATWNKTVAQLIGLAVARELRATGVRWSLGPSLTVCRDLRWGHCYESYSENERLVRMLGSAIDGIGGMPKGSMWARIIANDVLVAATGLGFMGGGGAKDGRSGGDTQLPDREFRAVFMRPFFDGVSRGLPLVQLQRGSVNGHRIHDSEYLFGILKGQLRFRGVVVSAYRGIEDLDGDWATQVRTAVNRGVDMVRVGPKQALPFLQALLKEVTTGAVPVSRVDDAVTRILRLKAELGLIADPCGAHNLSLEVVGNQAHRQLARSAVRQSLVLLKNGGNGKAKILPLPRTGVRVLVTGSHSDSLLFQCGGHAAQWEGADGPVGTTILEGIREVIGEAALVQAGPTQAANVSADYTVVVVGEKPYAGDAGDQASNPHILYLEDTAVDLVLRVCSATPCLLVLVTGRPLYIEQVLHAVDALLVAWLPGSEGGGGVADMVFDFGHDFTGGLPVTWARNTSSLPLNYGNESYDPLFPLGFGLTLNGTVLDRKKQAGIN